MISAPVAKTWERIYSYVDYEAQERAEPDFYAAARWLRSALFEVAQQSGIPEVEDHQGRPTTWRNLRCAYYCYAGRSSQSIVQAEALYADWPVGEYALPERVE